MRGGWGLLELGGVAMLGGLVVVVAELLYDVGADEEGGGEEDLDDDEYCGYHCSSFFLVVNTGGFRFWTGGLIGFFALQR